PRVVRVRSPLLQRSDPVALGMSQSQEALDQAVPGIVAEAADDGIGAEQPGVLLDVQEEPEQGVANGWLAAGSRKGGVELLEVGPLELFAGDLAAGDRQDRLARPARLPLRPRERG